jgi:DNA-binding CsgD family transcriptional regulator
MAYLTDTQRKIWDLSRRGLSQAEIGRNVKVTRQAIFDALGIALDKVDSALRHTAEANMIEIRFVDPRNGILLGFSPSANQRVIITFSVRHGIQTWHYENPHCFECRWVEQCQRRLLDEAAERNVPLTAEEMSSPPSKLAHTIFSRVILGLEP